jgi:hypothetical protein
LTVWRRWFALKRLCLQGVYPGWPNGEQGGDGPGFWNFPLLSNGVKGKIGKRESAFAKATEDRSGNGKINRKERRER